MASIVAGGLWWREEWDLCPAAHIEQVQNGCGMLPRKLIGQRMSCFGRWGRAVRNQIGCNGGMVPRTAKERGEPGCHNPWCGYAHAQHCQHSQDGTSESFPPMHMRLWGSDPSRVQRQARCQIVYAAGFCSALGQPRAARQRPGGPNGNGRTPTLRSLVLCLPPDLRHRGFPLHNKPGCARFSLRFAFATRRCVRSAYPGVMRAARRFAACPEPHHFCVLRSQGTLLHHLMQPHCR